MGENIRHNCGLCVASTLHDAHSFGKSIQHRGREAAGVAAFGHDRVDVVKWKGVVDAFDLNDLSSLFPGHNYHTFLFHVRYATRGRKDKILEDAHPHVIGGKKEDRGSHVLYLDCEDAIIHNGQVDISSESFNFLDKIKLNTGCDSEAILYFLKEKGPVEFIKQVPDSYVFAATNKKNNRVIIGRDRKGKKPGCLFLKSGRFGMASEDIAPRKNGGEFIEDLELGAIYYLYPDYKQPKPINVVEGGPSHCFFEWNYVSDVDSILDGVSVRGIRKGLGEALAKEFDFRNADIVSYVPRCPEVAARSYAKKLNLNFEPLFYKMRAERSFQGSTLEERADSIDSNLFLISGMEKKLKGANVVIIDDSFVRGNVLYKIKKLFSNVDAKEIHIISYTPPIGIIGRDGVARGCKCGVDMPPEDSFLARKNGKNLTEEEISKRYGEKIHVHYLSMEGMFSAYEKLGMPRENLDTYCIGGNSSK